MEKLELKFKDAENALLTLEEILKEPYSVYIRDATIQRFEYTFEALWKFIQCYLKEKEGIISNSPKSVFREIFSLGVLTGEETEKCLEMVDTRNEIAHTYKKELSENIFKKVFLYSGLIKKNITSLKNKI